MKGVEKISRWTGCDTHGFPSSPRALPSCSAFFAMVGIAERGSARATSRRIFARSPIKKIKLKSASFSLFRRFVATHHAERRVQIERSSSSFTLEISQLSVRHPCHAASQPIRNFPCSPLVALLRFRKSCRRRRDAASHAQYARVKREGEWT